MNIILCHIFSPPLLSGSVFWGKIGMGSFLPSLISQMKVSGFELCHIDLDLNSGSSVGVAISIIALVIKILNLRWYLVP